MSLMLNSFRRALASSSSLRIASRSYSASAAAETPSSDSSASQPGEFFSLEGIPCTRAHSLHTLPVETRNKPEAPALNFTSSCVEGTPLAGLGLLKDAPDPVALPDTAYPAWLWELHSAGAGGSAVAGASAGMTKGEQRAALKRASKAKRIAADKAARSGTTATQEVAQEMDMKRQLKMKNKENIKGNNFMKSK